MLNQGISEESIIYIDLDDRSNRQIKDDEQLEKLTDKKSNYEGLKYLFIDEIQNVKSFEELINGYRTEGNYSIFITGSNSYLLSSEIVTKLTSRYLEFELFPLTFDEYYNMKKFYGQEVDSNLMVEFNNFIMEGGFPRTLFIEGLANKRKYVNDVFNEIFEKDIRKRVKIKNKELFENVKTYIINNYSSTTSVKSLHKSLTDLGYTIKESTVNKYISALAEAKILYECKRFDMKSKKSLKGEKKYYLSDLSFYFSINTDNRINYGATLENIVYIYVKKSWLFYKCRQNW